MKHRFIILLLLTSFMSMDFAVAQNFNKTVAIKSLILPGWGQRSLNNNSRSEFFIATEILSYIAVGVLSNQKILNFQDMSLYAVQHAGIIYPNGKNDVFYDDIGNFISVTDYNETMLRRRDYFGLYSESIGYGWEWESEDNQKNYMGLKTNYYQSKRNLSYAFGAIALNHIVSSIDALLLSKKNLKINPISSLTSDIKGIQVSFTF